MNRVSGWACRSDRCSFARAEPSGSGPGSGKTSEAGSRAISGRHLKSRKETPEAVTKKKTAGGKVGCFAGEPARGITGSGNLN